MVNALPPSAAPGKSIWQSKTFWLNLAGALAILIDSPIGALLPPEYLAAILAGLNIINRFFTDVPIVVMKGE